jgi:glycosyltransferase involved in cell wall biosynthesis
LAQFFIRNVAPDYTVCDQYYYVSDQDALQAFLKGKRPSGEVAEIKPSANQSGGATKRNALTMLIRNMVWDSMRWAGKPFWRWVEEFSPDVILLQAGDCAFMLNLARKLAIKYDVPLIIYNSEAYYFKKYDYFCAQGLPKMLYPLFRMQLCQAFKKCMAVAKKTIYCCDKLKEDYDASFGLSSEAIYTVTQIEPKITPSNGHLQISYLGNLGVGRHEGLVEIGNALQRISPELKLRVYGKIPNQTVQTAFDDCQGVDYGGFVSYEEVVEIIHNSDILVHTESFSEFYREDLKYAFSTKIADSLASGTCFLLYAPRGMACTDYLIEKEAAWVVSEKNQLQSTLEQLCGDEPLRNRYIQRAISLAQENHSPTKNTMRFQEMIKLFANHYEGIR